MNEPAIIAALIGVLGAFTIALVSVVYRFGKLASCVENLRREASLRHDDLKRNATERYEALARRLERLESHFITRSSGDGD